MTRAELTWNLFLHYLFLTYYYLLWIIFNAYGIIHNFAADNIPSLTLFNQKLLQGDETFVEGEDGTELRLAVPQHIQSFSITGQSGWKVWSGVEWNGESKCLVPKSESRATDNDGETLYKELNETITVGSLKIGCEHPERETVTYTSHGSQSHLWFDCIVLMSVFVSYFY